MRYFLKTKDPLYVDAWKALTEVRDARYYFFKEKVESWGFHAFGMEDFCIPHAFFILRKEGDKSYRGPAIEGFKGGKLSFQKDGAYFHYTLHGRNRRATELRKQLEGAPPAPAELNGNHFRRDREAAFCARFGLPNAVFDGGRINFALIYLLHDGTLVCSLPFSTGGRDPAPAVIPEGTEEITERAFRELIDQHNAAVAKDEEKEEAECAS